MLSTTLDVALGDRSYPVIVTPGGLDGLGEAMRSRLATGRVVVVTNPVVAPHHLDATLDTLRDAGFEPVELTVPDGEAYKTIDTWHVLVSQLLGLGVDRRTPVVALGGGVTGDLAGFAAATALRGLPLVQVPTSLLAMVDSAVGGKTGVNTKNGKNLVGAFYQPVLVYAAIETLHTLPEDEMRCGLGEVIKHGVIRDAELFELCETRAADIRARSAAILLELVVRSCRVKADVVAQDEREGGLRAILNFGHTVGHALETALGHGTLRHGECVAIGMIAEAHWAVRRGACGPEVPDLIARITTGLGLPVAAPSCDPDRLIAAACFDKKAAHGTLSTVVVDEIGSVHLERIPMTELADLFQTLPGFSEA